MMKNSGLLVANEIHPKRVWSLAENLERCGVRNAILTNETPSKLANHFGAFFDRVLVDAPCSGEGMMRKSEIARKEWKPELVISCAQRQKAIMNEAARLVRPGGWLSYTTCTFSSEENESVIANFLNDHPEFELKEIPPSPGYKPARPEWVGLTQMHPISRAIRLWPHHLSGEGHFIALLNKNGANDISRTDVSLGKRTLPNMLTKSSLNRSMFRLVEDFFLENLSYSLHPQQLIISGSYIYHPPDNFQDLTGLKVIHPGWWLGSINKGRFIPSHTLALGITSEQARREVPLSLKSRQVFSYLSGESFPDPGEDGWVLVTIEGFPLGWGKRVKGIVKNYYPHGLRWQIKFQDKFIQQ
jgi:NOL1/NOP2/fmu family ribosome biogenesis protein